MNFKHRFNHKDKGGFPNFAKKHGAVINCTLDGVSIHPVNARMQAPFQTQLPARKETAQGFPHEANGDFKTVTEFNSCDMRELRMDQQHCSYSTILT